jgi:hypothetical protein
MKEFDGDDLGPWAEFGTAAGIAATRAAAASAPAEQGLGDAPGGGGGETVEARSGLGDAPDLDGLPPVTGPGEALGHAVHDAAAKVGESAPPKGYHNRVDADGDGHLDEATYRAGEHGGADILVDLDGDGRTDFIGHDTDLDNRVDYADYDKDHDGVFEKRMYDDDGDGYLDRSVWSHDS